MKTYKKYWKAIRQGSCPQVSIVHVYKLIFYCWNHIIAVNIQEPMILFIFISSMILLSRKINRFQQLFRSPKRRNGFYMKHNTLVKWMKSGLSANLFDKSATVSIVSQKWILVRCAIILGSCRVAMKS